MYKKGNKDVIPTDSIVGADPTQIHHFFKRCGQHLKSLNNYPSYLEGKPKQST